MSIWGTARTGRSLVHKLHKELLYRNGSATLLLSGLKRSIILMRYILAVFILFASSSAALACQFDTDCFPGSGCLKSAYSIYGVCAGGISPGNSNDQQPVTSPLDPNRTYGNTCSFNTDCGPGSTCFKSGGIYGVCIR